MAQDKEFPKGLMVKDKTERQPDFVIANVSIKVEDLINYLQTCNPKNGWWNGQIKRSQGGVLYIERDTWESPDRGAYVPPVPASAPAEVGGDESSDLPF